MTGIEKITGRIEADARAEAAQIAADLMGAADDTSEEPEEVHSDEN